jgi:L-methionine (R)-S-oxide reductase
MDASEYATRVGLSGAVQAAAVRSAQERLWRVLDEVKKASVPATPKTLDRLYTCQVPRLSADGSCSLGELEPQPYDLSVALGGRELRTSLCLMALDALVDEAVRTVGADWLGVYQVRELADGPALVKLASHGVPSRVLFPLTAAFAESSNNVAVARSGQARVLHDVQAHVAAGGAYYECDPKVRAEACLPVFSQTGVVVGLVDAEAVQPNFFTEPRLATLFALALEVPGHLP